MTAISFVVEKNKCTLIFYTGSNSYHEAESYVSEIFSLGSYYLLYVNNNIVGIKILFNKTNMKITTRNNFVCWRHVSAKVDDIKTDLQTLLSTPHYQLIANEWGATFVTTKKKWSPDYAKEE
jgi:hypothetical protein